VTPAAIRPNATSSIVEVLDRPVAGSVADGGNTKGASVAGDTEAGGTIAADVVVIAAAVVVVACVTTAAWVLVVVTAAAAVVVGPAVVVGAIVVVVGGGAQSMTTANPPLNTWFGPSRTATSTVGPSVNVKVVVRDANASTSTSGTVTDFSADVMIRSEFGFSDRWFVTVTVPGHVAPTFAAGVDASATR
jgi:hypothetical protein